MSGFDRKGKPNVVSTERRHTSTRSPRVEETLVDNARLAGYTGNICDVCGSTRMRQAGHCLSCDDCGTTTGCS